MQPHNRIRNLSSYCSSIQKVCKMFQHSSMDILTKSMLHEMLRRQNYTVKTRYAIRQQSLWLSQVLLYNGLFRFVSQCSNTNIGNCHAVITTNSNLEMKCKNHLITSIGNWNIIEFLGTNTTAHTNAHLILKFTSFSRAQSLWAIKIPAVE